jgi:hypothetical protein
MLKCSHIYTLENKKVSSSKTIKYIHSPKMVPAQRLVEALLGHILLERLHGEGSASLGTSRLVDTGKPDLPASANSAGAGLEALVALKTAGSEDEVTIVVDLEGAALLVLANGLDAGGVADVALAHAGAVDV